MWKENLAAFFIVPASIAVAGCTQSGEAPRELTAVASEESDRPALRVVKDLARGQRWELGWGMVSAYDLGTGERIRTVRLHGANLSGAPETCVPDMVLSRTGALIVSSNAQPSLWRISPSRFEVERFDIAVDSDADKDFGFTALAWGADEQVLYAATAITGSLWRIDLNSATARRVELSSPVRGACGLAASLGERRGRQGPELLVTIGSAAGAARIALAPDLQRGYVSREPGSVARLASQADFRD